MAPYNLTGDAFGGPSHMLSDARIARLQWVLIGSVGVEFLLPHRILAALSLASRSAQVASCMILVLSEVMVRVAMSKPGRSLARIGDCVIGGTLMIVLYLGLLEAAQLLTADRHARVTDLAYNCSAVVVVGAAIFALAWCLVTLAPRTGARRRAR